MDPDDAFSSVPYEKGHTFLYYIEHLLGGPEVFEPFLKSYLDKFKYKSIVTSTWKDYLYEYFKDKVEVRCYFSMYYVSLRDFYLQTMLPQVLNSIDWDTWFYKSGMPPVIPAYNTTLIQACAQLANRWLQWDQNTPSPFKKSDITVLSSNQRIEFLAELLSASETLSREKLQAMNEAYDFDSVKNAEIRYQEDTVKNLLYVPLLIT